MPFYLDLHRMPGVTSAVVTKHNGVLKVQEDLNCKFITHWVDEDRGRAFCLISAPDKNAVRKLHEKYLGIVPLKIMALDCGTVKSFLENADDLRTEMDNVNNLKIFNDPTFQIIMIIETLNEKLLKLSIGSNRALELLSKYHLAVRACLKKHEGSELPGENFLAIFTSVYQALNCALEILKALQSDSKSLNLRISLHGGTAITKNFVSFNEVVKLGKYLCSIGKESQIVISPIIHGLCKKEEQKMEHAFNSIWPINTSDETFLKLAMDTLENNYRNPIFGIDDFCFKTSISKSELYRKSKNVTGMSIKRLLREYRLQKSLAFLEKGDFNITQISFDLGFNSPSYFSKCFYKRFGLQPQKYRKELV